MVWLTTVQSFLGCLQEGDPTTYLVVDIQMFSNPFHEGIPPYVQPKPPLVHPEGISSCLVSGYLGEESDAHLGTPSSSGSRRKH